MEKIKAAITAVGGYVPEFVMTNQELEKIVDTNDEWISLEQLDRGTALYRSLIRKYCLNS